MDFFRLIIQKMHQKMAPLSRLLQDTGCSKVFLFFALIFTHGISFAFTPKEIIVRGNTSTKTYIIKNEIGFREGQDISEEDLIEARRRLNNMDLFKFVEVKKVDDEIHKQILITVEERWTTIPILKASSGGGVQLLTLGAYDPNIGGHYLEAGAQYQRLGETNSGVVWFKNPRLFGERNEIELQGWQTNRIRIKYDQSEEEPIIRDGFLHTRSKALLAYRHEFSNFFASRLIYEFNQDSFSKRLLSDEVQQVTQNKSLPVETVFHFLGLHLTYGQINTENYLVDGNQFNFLLRQGISDTASVDDFTELNLSFNYYKTTFKDHTFAQRINFGSTSTSVLQYWYYLGGLDSVRGFADNRFAGRYHWLSNSEYRIPVWKTDNIVMQTVGFLDLVNASEKSKDISNLSGASLGAGLRFFLPKFYRSTLRIDYAQPIKKEDSNSINFGVQQFF